MFISQINIYPIKSLGGFSVSSARVFFKGLQYDRRWMLVDENNRFLTQRTLPQMALFATAIAPDDNKLEVRFDGRMIHVPLSVSGTSIRAMVWNDEVEVLTMDAAIDDWFSQQMGFKCRLVFFPEGHQRRVDPDFAISSQNQTSLSDGYPVLIIGQASLDDLNKRLVEPVGMDRFRPNIVCTGGLPYAEDGWSKFTIGEVAMAGVKPCARCTVTTIDQQTARVGKEPLTTLGTYRKAGNKVLFGQNVIPLNEGLIAVGDALIVS